MDARDDGAYVRVPEAADVARVCGALNAAGARYLLIGGFAVIAHGLGRPTKDIDFLVDDSPDNVARVKAGLAVLADGNGQGSASFCSWGELTPGGPDLPLRATTIERRTGRSRMGWTLAVTIEIPPWKRATAAEPPIGVLEALVAQPEHVEADSRHCPRFLRSSRVSP